MTEKAVLTRTSHGLVDALFDSIDRLNAKEIDPEHARAISHTAKTIVAIANLELEVRKFRDAHQGSNKGELSSLTIETTAATS